MWRVRGRILSGFQSALARIGAAVRRIHSVCAGGAQVAVGEGRGRKSEEDVVGRGRSGDAKSMLHGLLRVAARRRPRRHYGFSRAIAAAACRCL
jgi:hypothetical protein